MGSPVNGIKPLERSRRVPARGSFAGLWTEVKSPRVAISFTPDLLDLVRTEAEITTRSFAEIVRRRLYQSYRASAKAGT